MREICGPMQKFYFALPYSFPDQAAFLYLPFFPYLPSLVFLNHPMRYLNRCLRCDKHSLCRACTFTVLGLVSASIPRLSLFITCRPYRLASLACFSQHKFSDIFIILVSCFGEFLLLITLPSSHRLYLKSTCGKFSFLCENLQNFSCVFLYFSYLIPAYSKYHEKTSCKNLRHPIKKSAFPAYIHKKVGIW